MRLFLVILFFLFSPFVAIYAQTDVSKIKEIKIYRESIDSLYRFYDSLRNILTVEADSTLAELKLRESISEGRYSGHGKEEFVGGFEVYTFYKNDLICRILFSGGKNDAYVTKHYYFRNGYLVFAEMTVREWKDNIGIPYKVEEFYSGKNVIAKKTENPFPKLSDRSLIPNSLIQDGMKLLKLESKN